MADREIDQRDRDCGADPLDQRLGAVRPLEQEPHNRDEADENAEADELTQPELLRRRLEQRCVAVGQRLPRERGEDDGNEVAERSEDEEARVALGTLEVAGDGEPDKEADVHAGVVPEEGSFAARVLRGKTLREHHVDAGDVETAAGKEKSKADVEQRERADSNAGAADNLQHHAPDEEVAVRKEPAPQVAAEEVQAVVEGAEHAHQRGGRFHGELEVLRGVEDQRRVEDGEAERTKDLNEEEHGRALRSAGETACEKFHPALLCRSPRRAMSSHAHDAWGGRRGRNGSGCRANFERDLDEAPCARAKGNRRSRAYFLAGGGAPTPPSSMAKVQVASTFFPLDFAVTKTVQLLSRSFCVT